jgi:hypothetical protein
MYDKEERPGVELNGNGMYLYDDKGATAVSLSTYRVPHLILNGPREGKKNVPSSAIELSFLTEMDNNAVVRVSHEEKPQVQMMSRDPIDERGGALVIFDTKEDIDDFGRAEMKEVRAFLRVDEYGNTRFAPCSEEEKEDAELRRAIEAGEIMTSTRRKVD